MSFVADVRGTAVLARGRTGGGAPDGLVALLDPATGRPRWQRRLGGDVFPNSLAVGPAGIQLVAQDPLTFEQLIAKRQRADRSPLHVRLIALGPTGRPRWRRPLHEVTGGDDPIEDVRVTAAGSRVVAIGQPQHGARIEVFEAGTGARRWSRPVERTGQVLAWPGGDRRPSAHADIDPGLLPPAARRHPARVLRRPARRRRPGRRPDPLAAADRGGVLPVRARPWARAGLQRLGGRRAGQAGAGPRLYVVDDETGAVAGGRPCGLHDPATGSPLVATAEMTVYLTLYGVVAYPLRTG